jgi:hypothetical protein
MGACHGQAVMSLHELSACDGYTYLTRQVAAADDTNRGYGTLASYYEQKGESPGVWMGGGIGSCPSVVPEFSVGGPVSEAQMVALFGEGRHPTPTPRAASNEPSPTPPNYCAAEYVDAIAVAAESVLGSDNLARLDATVETTSPGLTGYPA